MDLIDFFPPNAAFDGKYVKCVTMATRSKVTWHDLWRLKWCWTGLQNNDAKEEAIVCPITTQPEAEKYTSCQSLNKEAGYMLKTQKTSSCLICKSDRINTPHCKMCIWREGPILGYHFTSFSIRLGVFPQATTRTWQSYLHGKAADSILCFS